MSPARLLAILAALALALQGAAPAMAAPGDSAGHFWCGDDAEPAAAAAVEALLDATGKTAPAGGAPHHDPLCALCCAAMAAPVGVAPAPAPVPAARVQVQARFTPPARGPAPLGADAIPNPPRGPPAV